MAPRVLILDTGWNCISDVDTADHRMFTGVFLNELATLGILYYNLSVVHPSLSAHGTPSCTGFHEFSYWELLLKFVGKFMCRHNQPAQFVTCSSQLKSHGIEVSKIKVQCDSFGTRPKKMRISERLFIRLHICIHTLLHEKHVDTCLPLSDILTSSGQRLASGAMSRTAVSLCCAVVNLWINLMMTSSETAVFSRMEPHATPRMRA